MTLSSRRLLQCTILLLLLLLVWTGAASAKSVRAHPKRERCPCRNEAKTLCPNATSRTEGVQCLEENVENLKEGKCQMFIEALSACRADLSASATASAESSQGANHAESKLECAEEASTGSVKAIGRCLREWNTNRTHYGEALLSSNCTETKFFRKATKKFGGHRKRRGAISGRKSRK